MESILAQLSWSELGAVLGVMVVTSGTATGLWIRHEAKGRHMDPEKIVFKDVCAERHTALTLQIAEIKEDLKEIKFLLVGGDGDRAPRSPKRH